MKKVITLCALLCLCGCNIPQQAQPVPQKTLVPKKMPHTPQQDAPAQNTTVTNPSEPPSDAVDLSLMAPQAVAVIKQFANLLEVNDIKKEQFVFVTPQEEKIRVDALSIHKLDISLEQEARLGSIFYYDWFSYDSGKSGKNTIDVYLKDKVACKKHLFVHDGEHDESFDTGRNVRIVCGVIDKTFDDLYPHETMGDGICFETKAWVIAQSDEVRPHLAQLEERIHKNAGGVGLSDFVIKKEYITPYEDYLTLVEIYNEPDGTVREVSTMGFRYNRELEAFFISDFETEEYHTLHFGNRAMKEIFRKKCEQETEARAAEKYQNLL